MMRPRPKLYILWRARDDDDAPVMIDKFLDYIRELARLDPRFAKVGLPKGKPGSRKDIFSVGRAGFEKEALYENRIRLLYVESYGVEGVGDDYYLSILYGPKGGLGPKTGPSIASSHIDITFHFTDAILQDEQLMLAIIERSINFWNADDAEVRYNEITCPPEINLENMSEEERHCFTKELNEGKFDKTHFWFRWLKDGPGTGMRLFDAFSEPSECTRWKGGTLLKWSEFLGHNNNW